MTGAGLIVLMCTEAWAAPSKTLTTPRVEFVLLHFLNIGKKGFKIVLVQRLLFIFDSDSQIALLWIRTSSNLTNRVS